jgi:OOP family OmpA-OmpF porin
MRFIFAAVAATLLAAGTANAADDSFFYAGAGLGQFTVKTSRNSGNFDESDTAFRLILGWQMNDYLAFEGEYFDGGTPQKTWKYSNGDTEKASISPTGEVLSVVGIWPFAEQFNAFAKVGAVFWNFDLKDKYNYAGDGSDHFKTSDSGTDFAWGVGGTWKFSDRMGFVLQYQGFDIGSISNKNVHVNLDTTDLISGGLYMKF